MDSIPDFFDKLMIAKEMKFDQGSIKLFGHSVVLPPAKLFSEYIRMVGNDPKYTDLIYEAARVSFRDGMGKPPSTRSSNPGMLVLQRSNKPRLYISCNAFYIFSFMP